MTTNIGVWGQAARASTRRAPGFSYAWARLAELEFSFGRIGAARKAVDQSLSLAPRNGQAWAMQGFISAAQNRITEAIIHFDQAIALDPGFARAESSELRIALRANPAWGWAPAFSSKAPMSRPWRRPPARP